MQDLVQIPLYKERENFAIGVEKGSRFWRHLGLQSKTGNFFYFVKIPNES